MDRLIDRPTRPFPPGALVAVLVLALLAASAWMTRLGAPLATATSPSGIVDFELAGTQARAAAILAAWDDAAREAARVQTRWDDWLYVPLYVVALAAWALWGARRLGAGALARIGIALAWAMPAAGVLDWIENRQLVAQLAGGADATRAAVAAAAAGAKFAIVGATLLFALVATAIVAARAAVRARA